METDMPQTKTIALTAAAMAILRANVTPGHEFRDDSTPRPDGLFDVPVSPEALAMIDAARLPGESRSDLLARITARRQ
jgi:hypothetical protein